MRRHGIWILTLACLLAATSVLAQGNPTGTITGKVTDPDDLVLPGVTVTAASPVLQGVRTAVTSANGDYIIPFLPAGDYAGEREIPVQFPAWFHPVRRPDGGWDAFAADGTRVATAYVGLTTTVTDANGQRKDSVSDAYGRLQAVREYSGTAVYTTTYAYDVLNNLRAVTDALGHTTAITYDNLGRKMAMRDPDMGAWTYSYNALGGLVTQTDARNCVLTLGYDALNRLLTKSSSGACGTQVSASFTYDQGFNGIGRRTNMVDSSGSSAWTYDQRGRVLNENKIIPAGLTTYKLPPFPKASVPTEAQFADVQQWMKDKGLLSTDVPFANLVDASFLPR